MELKRQESAVNSEFDLMEQKTPSQIEDYSYYLELFTLHLRLLRQQRLSVLFKYNLDSMAENEAKLAAMDKVMAENAKKIHETRIKSTYSVRPEIASKLSASTSRVLTSSVTEIIREKNEIKVLLQQM